MIQNVRFTKAEFRFAYEKTVGRDGTEYLRRLPWAWVKLGGEDDFTYVQPLTDGHAAFTPYRSHAEYMVNAPFGGSEGVHYFSPV